MELIVGNYLNGGIYSLHLSWFIIFWWHIARSFFFFFLREREREREFQPMVSAPNNSSLSSDEDTNQFLV